MRKRSHLIVHLDHFSHNIEEIKKKAPNKEVIHMVKANAYGHGLVKIVEHSVHELGAKIFGCASMGEALYLRKHLSDLEFEVLVFSDFDLETDQQEILNNRIVPVISNLDDLTTFLSRSELKFVPLYLKFNTGMNRLGIRMDELEKTIDLLKKHGRNQIDHLMSHFACASLSIKKNSHNKRQVQNFKTLKAELSGAGIKINESSLANSGAIIQEEGMDETHVRPGLMMYGPGGLSPSISEQFQWNGKIVSQMQTYIIDEFFATKGTPIGYGAHPCPYEGQVAILGVGYGDGIGTCYNGLELQINQSPCRIIGRVNMDMLAVQVMDGAKDNFNKGDQVNIWDKETESVSRICHHAKMIPYEIFCDISARVPRIYR
jgi:alanine racemase